MCREHRLPQATQDTHTYLKVSFLSSQHWKRGCNGSSRRISALSCMSQGLEEHVIWQRTFSTCLFSPTSCLTETWREACPEECFSPLDCFNKSKTEELWLIIDLTCMRCCYEALCHMETFPQSLTMFKCVRNKLLDVRLQKFRPSAGQLKSSWTQISFYLTWIVSLLAIMLSGTPKMCGMCKHLKICIWVCKRRVLLHKNKMHPSENELPLLQYMVSILHPHTS